VIRDGQIVEKGSHSELIALHGHYSGLYKAYQEASEASVAA
jgi:ABC-type multidrug transport system fused ATPase/permease subunit